MDSGRPAIVVGLCGHGLAVARALSDAGIRVLALEAQKLPGFHTNSAEVIEVPDINGPGLVQSLIEVASGLDRRPVVFLTNDRMVETVANSRTDLESQVDISWNCCRSEILSLLDKHNIEDRCRQAGLNYPRTAIVCRLGAMESAVSGFKFPLILKPTRPLSGFKTIVVQDGDELYESYGRLKSSLPVLVQEFIAGDDSAIRFAALYLSRGTPIARFEGRKLRSRPMGHTTVAVSEKNDETHRQALRFFSGLNISGPVSLEMKRDTSGVDWVIEPTVGRTDFWVGLCIAAGVNLPVLEYRAATSESGSTADQVDNWIWINEERDPLALLWLWLCHTRMTRQARLRSVYFDRKDLAPPAFWIRQATAGLMRTLVAKARI